LESLDCTGAAAAGEIARAGAIG